MLQALHYFGIAQLLGIDEEDSDNVIEPHNTNGHLLGTQWYITLAGLQIADSAEALMSASGRPVDFQERWHGTSISNVPSQILNKLQVGVSDRRQR